MKAVRRRTGVLWMLALLLVTRLEVLRLRRQVERMALDPAFGCLTRQGAERRVRALRGPREVVFFDVNDMHRLNAQWGYTEVDRRIRAALAAVQLRQEDLVVGRWYSGDELFAVVPAGTGTGLCQRVERAFAWHGLSATYAVVPWQGSLTDTVDQAAKQVQQRKRWQRDGAADVNSRAAPAIDNLDECGTITVTRARNQEAQDA